MARITLPVRPAGPRSASGMAIVCRHHEHPGIAATFNARRHIAAGFARPWFRQLTQRYADANRKAVDAHHRDNGPDDLDVLTFRQAVRQYLLVPRFAEACDVGSDAVNDIYHQRAEVGDLSVFAHNSIGESASRRAWQNGQTRAARTL